METRGMDTCIQEWGQARSQELQTYHGITGLWQYLRTTSGQTDIWIYRPNIESCPDSLQKEQWIWEYNLKACRELVEACRKKDLDWKKVVGVLSSDMSKAFDSLWSPLLTEQVDACQFSKKALNLVRSYFSQRKNGVRLSKVWCQKRLSLGIYIWTLIVEFFQNDLAYADDHQIHQIIQLLRWRRGHYIMETKWQAGMKRKLTSRNISRWYLEKGSAQMQWIYVLVASK